MLVVHGLVRRGVPLPLATAALLVDLLSFYAAHALAVLLALGIIWVHHDLPPVLLTLVVFGRNNPSPYTVNGRPLYVHLNGLAIVLYLLYLSA
jgi:hypothetical protein